MELFERACRDAAIDRRIAELRLLAVGTAALWHWHNTVGSRSSTEASAMRASFQQALRRARERRTVAGHWGDV
jgi:hypothetical protein